MTAKIWYLVPILHKSKDKREAPRLLCTLYHNAAITVVRWSPNGEYLAVGTFEGIIKVYKWNGVLKDTPSEQYTESWISVFETKPHVLEVSDLCWSPDGTRIVSSSRDSKIIVTDLKTGGIAKLWNQDQSPRGVSWDPVGEYIAVQNDISLCIWHIDKDEVEYEIKTYFNSSTSKGDYKRPSWSPDGKYLIAAAGSKDKAHGVLMFSRDDHFSLRANLQVPNTSLSTCYNPNYFKSKDDSSPQFICTTCDTKGNVICWNKTGPFVRIALFFEDTVLDSRWTADGQAVLCCSKDGTVGVCIFDKNELPELMKKGEIEDHLKAHYKKVLAKPDIHDNPIQYGIEKKATPKAKPTSSSQESSTPGIRRITPEHINSVEFLTSPSQPFSIIPPPPEPLIFSDKPPMPDLSTPVERKAAPKKKTSTKNKSESPEKPSTLTTSGSHGNATPVTKETGKKAKTTETSPEKNGTKSSPEKSSTPMSLETEDADNQEEPSIKKTADKKRKRESEPVKPKKKAKAKEIEEESEDELFEEADEEINSPSEILPLPVPEIRTRLFKEQKDSLLEVSINQSKGESLIIFTKASKALWTVTINDRVSAIAANEQYCCFGCFSGDVYIFTMNGRRVLPCLNISSNPISLVDCLNQLVLVASSDGDIKLWNVEEKRVLASTNLEPLLKNNFIRVRKVGIQKGSVYVTMNNGNSYIYECGLKTWVQLHHIEYNTSECYLHYAKEPSHPDFIVRSIQSSAIDGMIPPNIGTLGSNTDESKKSRTIAYLEEQVALSELMNSPKEFKKWITEYVLKLSEDFQEAKLEEILSFLMGPNYAPSSLSKEQEEKYKWKSTILGIPKRSLLKELFQVMLNNRSLQRLISRYKADLEVIEQRFNGL